MAPGTVIFLVIVVSFLLPVLLYFGNFSGHFHDWTYTRHRDSGSLVMYQNRVCKCGAAQNRMITPYGSTKWRDDACTMP